MGGLCVALCALLVIRVSGQHVELSQSPSITPETYTATPSQTKSPSATRSPTRTPSLSFSNSVSPSFKPSPSPSLTEAPPPPKRNTTTWWDRKHSGLEPLLPPPQRVEAGLALTPLYSRGLPVEAGQLANKYSEESETGSALASAPEPAFGSVIGNEVSHRQYQDYAEDLVLVMPAMRFYGSGNVSQWSVYTGRNCKVHAQVYRPAPTPRALDENHYTVTGVTLVGTNILEIPSMGLHTFDINQKDQIKVQEDDMIGFFTPGPGCVSWSDGGVAVLYRYNMPGKHELEAFKSVVFIGDGLRRTYSISSDGDYTQPQRTIIQRPSPSPSSGPPSITPSITPTLSPSGSISVTPLNTPSPSTPPSGSYQPMTVTMSASPAPTQFFRGSDCNKGIDYWCASWENMRSCNITYEQCEVIFDALHPALPSQFPTVPTPSASVSPPLGVVSDGESASVTPSPSLQIAPYAMEPMSGSGSGLTNCHYCYGGSDWSADQCKSGKQQSPVVLKFEDVDVEPAMDLHFAIKYNIARARVSWNDYSFVISSSSFGSLNIDGSNYDADSVIIRAPSEHKIEGFKTPMELQIFHKLRGSNPPVVLAVAVLFEETAKQVPSLDWIFGLPSDKTSKDIVIDLEDYLSDLKPLAFYNGSMTQPPCQEGITWAISMGESAQVSFQQVKALNMFMKSDPNFAQGRGNNRETQAMGNRRFELRTNCGISGAVACDSSPDSKRVSVEDGGSGVVDDAMFDDGDVRLW